MGMGSMSLAGRHRAERACVSESSRRKESIVSVYKVVEVIGTSSTSWEDAAAQAVRTASESIRDIRVAEVVKQDIHLEEGTITYRTKLQVSFKYESGA
jgi:flavin-binding protein dodecin